MSGNTKNHCHHFIGHVFSLLHNVQFFFLYIKTYTEEIGQVSEMHDI